MATLLVLCVLVLAVDNVLATEDQVISRLDGGGPRYQYMAGPQGSELVDLWLKNSDINMSSRFVPEWHISFHLFTRRNPSTSRPIPLADLGALYSTTFNSLEKTVVLIHGWKNNPSSEFNVHLISAYLHAEDVNVLMVDWSIGAAANYLVAMNNAIRSGELITRYILWLISASGGHIARYHIIGHCLGAHLAGIVGRELKGRVPYITALEPSRPGWYSHPQVFTSDVAAYTEVIHTDAGFFGVATPLGVVDFYPNGGMSMPGCRDRLCDHQRSILYMAESLTSGGFTGRRCDSLQSALNHNCHMNKDLKMGGAIPKFGNAGIFDLTTNAVPPFSQG